MGNWTPVIECSSCSMEFFMFHGILEVWWNFRQIWRNFGGIFLPDLTCLGIFSNVRFSRGVTSYRNLTCTYFWLSTTLDIMSELSIFMLMCDIKNIITTGDIVFKMVAFLEFWWNFCSQKFHQNSANRRHTWTVCLTFLTGTLPGGGTTETIPWSNWNTLVMKYCTQKNKCWIHVYFTHRFNAQTNYLLHVMCKMPLVQQLANSHWCNVS